MTIKRKLQVFVSSTFLDLVPERQAAVSAILKAGHIPAGMELFTAGDQSQMVIIERWIDESDVYMLLLGGRYGSVEPKSNVGYTELEYDYAIAQGKPVFAVVMTDDAIELKVRDKGTDFIEKSNPKLLSEFRSKVLSNLSAFFTDEKDIKLAVYESLSDFAANRDLKGWVSATDVVDTTSMQQDLVRLRQDNSELRTQLAALSARKDKTSNVNNDLQDLASTLRSITVKLPEGLVEGKDVSNTLLNIFVNTRDSFVIGIHNKSSMTDYDQFLFFNIAPKLKVHGLVDITKVPGVPYRRAATTAKGEAFLAQIEREALKTKATRNATPPAATAT